MGNSTRIKAALAFLVAVFMTVPTVVTATAGTDDELIPMTGEALDEFVASWSDALLSRDLDRVEAMPAPDAYAQWTVAFRMYAIDELYVALDAARPADEPALTNETQIAMVKNFLFIHVFNRDFAPDVQPPTEFEEDLDSIDLGDPLGDARESVNADIAAESASAAKVAAASGALATVAPHGASTLGRLVALGWVGSLLAELPGEAGTVPPEDVVRDALEPHVAVASRLVPVSGTYTLRVKTDRWETVIQDVPFGTLVPVDADDDATTGAGGVDIFAGVMLQSAPDADATVDAPDASVGLRDLAPSLVVKRAAHDEAPDFSEYGVALVEAYVGLNGGRSVARVGFDLLQSDLPEEVSLTFSADVVMDARSGSALLEAVDGTLPVLQRDARAFADAVAAEGDVTIPWDAIDAAPATAEGHARDANALAEAQRAAMEAYLLEVQAYVDETTDRADPYLEYAEQTSQWARDAVEDAGGPGVPEPDASLEDEQAKLKGTVDPLVDYSHELEAYAQRTAAPVIGPAEDAAASAEAGARGIADWFTRTAAETEVTARDAVARTADDAGAALAPADAALAAARADAYDAVVGANVAVGEQVNGARPVARGAVADAESTDAPLALAARAPGPADEARQLAEDARGAVEESAAAPSETALEAGKTFRVEVKTVEPRGDIVAFGGVTEFDLEGEVREVTAAVLSLENPGDLLAVTYTPGDVVRATIESTAPTTLGGFVVRDVTGGSASVTQFSLGPLPTLMDVAFSEDEYRYRATSVVEHFGVEHLRLTHEALAEWLHGGALTARYLRLVAAGIPTSIDALVGDDASSYRASGILGALSYTRAKFARDALTGSLHRFTLTGIPSEWDLVMEPGGAAGAFKANGPIASIEAVRTNGGTIGGVPTDAFAVAYRRDGDRISHLKLFGLSAFAAGTGEGGTFLDARVDGGYPFFIASVRDRMSVRGVLGEMPDHLGFEMKPSHGTDVRVIMEPASDKGLVAVAELPDFADKTAVLTVSNLPAEMHVVMDARVPSVDYRASGGIGAIVAGLVDADGVTAASVAFRGVPTAFYFGMTQFANGLPKIHYEASASTLDVYLWVNGDRLDAFPGHAFLKILNLPAHGLTMWSNGNSFHLRAPGDRLTQLYIDVGYRFAGALRQTNQFADSWWLDAGASVDFTYKVNVNHFVVNLLNARSLDVNPQIPMLDINVDGVIGTYFDLDLYSKLYARAWAYVFGFIKVVDIKVTWSHAGALPIAFTSWSTKWLYWSIAYFGHPIICDWEWYGPDWGWRTYYYSVGVRLPDRFYTTVNGFGVSYGTASFFMNPGNVVPFWAVYGYAIYESFDFKAWSWKKDRC